MRGDALLTVTSALKVHPTSVELWLVRLAMAAGKGGVSKEEEEEEAAGREGKGGVSKEEEEEGVRELGNLSRDALRLIPVQVYIRIYTYLNLNLISTCIPLF